MVSEGPSIPIKKKCTAAFEEKRDASFFSTRGITAD